MINGAVLWNRSRTADMIEKTSSGKTYLAYSSLPASSYGALSLSAACYPDKVTVMDDSGAAYTHTELRDMANRFSSYLYYISDIRPGIKIDTMVSNSVEFCVTFLALTKLGAVVIPLPSKYSRNEALSLTTKTDLQYILCDGKFYDRSVSLETSDAYLIKPERSQDGFGFSHLYASYLDSVPSLDREEDDTLIMFTSSTTSQSKGVIIRNYNTTHAVVSYQRILQITNRDTILIPILICLMTGLVALLGLTLYAGRVAYLHEFLDAKQALRGVDDKEITFLYAAPAMFSLLLREKDSFPSLPSLELLTYGNSNMSREKLTEIYRWLPCAVFHTVYELIETCSPVTIFPGDASTSSHIGSSGLPIPGTYFCILDDSGSQIQAGQVGEIAAKGTVLLDRYYQKGTGELDEDGWLRIEDLEYFNEEGYLFIVDRKRDTINRGGEKIWSFDIENELHKLDGIDETAVMGIPYDIHGEALVAMVKLSPENILMEQQMQDLLKCGITRYVAPSRILFLNKFPLAPNSRVNRSAMRRLSMQPEQ